MAGRLQDRIALICGAARGIGAGIAELFLEEGARIVISDRDPAGQATAERLSAKGEAIFVQCDISQADQVSALVAAVIGHYGRVDILHQNAGIFPQTDLKDIPVAEWDEVLGVNLRGCFLTAQACFKPMQKEGYGRIIFTSSITGTRVSTPGHAHYAASKGGINGLIRSAALEFAPFGITVNGIEPGNIMTEGMREHRSEAFVSQMERSVPLGRLGTPRDVAEASAFLASEAAGYITGTTIIVDGGQILSESKV